LNQKGSRIPAKSFDLGTLDWALAKTRLKLILRYIDEVSDCGGDVPFTRLKSGFGGWLRE
jgi:hypothetical protein